MYILYLLLVKFALFNKVGKPNNLRHFCTSLFQECSRYLSLLHFDDSRRRAGVKQKAQFVLTVQKLMVGLDHLGPSWSAVLTGIKAYQ